MPKHNHLAGSRYAVVFLASAILCATVPAPTVHAWAKKNDDAKKRYKAFLDKKIKEYRSQKSKAEAQLKTSTADLEQAKKNIEPLRTQVDAAKAKVDAIRQDLTEATKAVLQIEAEMLEQQKSLRKELLDNPEAEQLEFNYNQARDHLIKIERPLVDRIRRNSKMLDLAEQTAAAQEQVKALRVGGATNNEIQAATLELLRLHNKTRDLHAALLAADKSYVTAKKKFDIADAAYDKHRLALQATLKEDSAIQSTQARVDDGRSDIAALQRRLTDATRAYTKLRSDYSRDESDLKKLAKSIDAITGQIRFIDQRIKLTELKKKRAK